MAALTFLKPYKRKVVLSPEELHEIEMSSRTFEPAPVKSVEIVPSPRRTSVYSISVQSATSNNEQHHLTPVAEDEEYSSPGVAVRTPNGPRGDTDVAIPTSVNPIHGVVDAGSVDGFNADVHQNQERRSFPSFSASGGATPRRTSIPASERFSFSSQAGQEYKKRTALPFEPLVMTFRNVEYSVSLPKNANVDPATITSSGPHAGQLRLLKDISGVFRPHVLTALMGASGAGKTTLMDVLAGRKTGGVITGDIRVNGHPKEDKTFAHVSGYVEQTDVHLPQSSVREALEFSAALRLPTTVDASTRGRFVSEILELVELDRIQGAYVGVPGVSGLSVEQRKRLTLAVELVANPSIIFMDEPTSGLDARAASIVMTAIRNTVNSGRTVTCTIHQPSVDIFESFDELLLLKPGGRTVYFGPLGDGAERLIDYLQGLPGIEPIKPRYNPANWMLESLGKEGSLSIDFAEAYKQSEVANEMEQVIAKAEVPPSGSKPMEIEELHLPPWKLQFFENLKRFNRMYWRSPEYNLTRALVTLLIAFAFGTLFWRQGQRDSTSGGVLNIAGVLFSSVLFMGITNCLTVQHIVALQRSIMYRERAAGYYGVVPFALAQQAVELPYLLVQAIIYSMIVYWCVYFAVDAGKFFWFVLFFLLTLIYFVIFGMMAVALTPAVALANVFCSLWFGIMNLYSGFIKPEPAMPVYWRYWVPWANPVAWSIYGLSVSQLGNVNDVYVVNFTGQTVTVSEFLAQRFNWHYYMVGPIVAILVGFTALFSAITVLSLKFINYQRR